MKFIFAILISISMSSQAFAQSQALNHLVYEIRDPQTQPSQFRQSLERIGEYLAINVLQEFSTKETTVKTLTGEDAKHHLADETPVLVTILRAGLPLNYGVHKVFPKSEVGFLAMSRDETTLKARVDYIGIPDLKDRTVIITDTMLATGGSLLDAIKIVEQYNPKRIFVICAIAAKPGIERIQKYNPSIKIFAAAIDPILNDKGYIVPGLGDAGDRAFGMKHILE